MAAATKIEKEHIEAKIWDDKQCPPQRDLDELFATRGIIRASKVVNFSQRWLTSVKVVNFNIRDL